MTDAVKRAVDILNRKLLNGTLSGADEMETIIRTEIERDNRTPPAGWKLVPIEPTPGLLMSMAIRSDHGLGVPGHYDQFGQNHKRRLEVTLNDMRKLYEEVVGAGFYKPEREQEYVALSAAPENDDE